MAFLAGDFEGGGGVAVDVGGVPAELEGADEGVVGEGGSEGEVVGEAAEGGVVVAVFGGDFENVGGGEAGADVGDVDAGVGIGGDEVGEEGGDGGFGVELEGELAGAAVIAGEMAGVCAGGVVERAGDDGVVGEAGFTDGGGFVDADDDVVGVGGEIKGDGDGDFEVVGLAGFDLHDLVDDMEGSSVGGEFWGGGEVEVDRDFGVGADVGAEVFDKDFGGDAVAGDDFSGRGVGEGDF